jgi:general secretion pathway protein D
MKTLHPFIIRPGRLAGGIFALIILLSLGGPAFAARVAGTDDTVNTTTIPVPPAVQPEDTQKKETAPPADTTNKVIEVSPAAPVAPLKQEVPPAEKDISPAQSKDAVPPETPAKKAINSAQPSKEVKTENVIQKHKEMRAEKLPSGSAKKEADKRYVTIDFDNVDIGVLVKFVSELTGKNFIIDDKVKGKVTIISPKKIPLEDVYKVFLSVLEVNGFTVVPAGNMIKIIPAVLAREKSLETRLKNELATPEDRMVTQIVALERANPMK